MRRVASVLVLLALLVACEAMPGSLEEIAEDLESRLLEEADAEVPAEDPHGSAEGSGESAEGGQPVDEASSGDAPQQDARPDGDDGQDGAGAPTVSFDDAGPVGANSLAILRADVPRLFVEVDVQEGLSASGAAVDHLRSVLGRETDKPDGVHIVQRGLSSEQRTWTASQVRELAERRRQQRSNADQVAIYIAYLRGSFENPDAIGVAVNASTIAVFPDQWRGTVETLVGASTAVERAVLVHEVGHLMGLVELTYSSIHDRHDREHPGHSTNRGSVMHWAIATTAVGQVFSGPPPDDFDQADRDDLRYLRTGSW